MVDVLPAYLQGHGGEPLVYPVGHFVVCPVNLRPLESGPALRGVAHGGSRSRRVQVVVPAKGRHLPVGHGGVAGIVGDRLEEKQLRGDAPGRAGRGLRVECLLGGSGDSEHRAELHPRRDLRSRRSIRHGETRHALPAARPVEGQHDVPLRLLVGAKTRKKGARQPGVQTAHARKVGNVHRPAAVVLRVGQRGEQRTHGKDGPLEVGTKVVRHPLVRRVRHSQQGVPAALRRVVLHPVNGHGRDDAEKVGIYEGLVRVEVPGDAVIARGEVDDVPLRGLGGVPAQTRPRIRHGGLVDGKVQVFPVVQRGKRPLLPGGVVGQPVDEIPQAPVQGHGEGRRRNLVQLAVAGHDDLPRRRVDVEREFLRCVEVRPRTAPARVPVQPPGVSEDGLVERRAREVEGVGVGVLHDGGIRQVGNRRVQQHQPVVRKVGADSADIKGNAPPHSRNRSCANLAVKV